MEPQKISRAETQNKKWLVGVGANEQITMNNYQLKKVDRSEGKRNNRIIK